MPMHDNDLRLPNGSIANKVGTLANRAMGALSGDGGVWDEAHRRCSVDVGGSV